jgi:hypothetical protein
MFKKLIISVFFFFFSLCLFAQSVKWIEPRQTSHIDADSFEEFQVFFLFIAKGTERNMQDKGYLTFVVNENDEIGIQLRNVAIRKTTSAFPNQNNGDIYLATADLGSDVLYHINISFWEGRPYAYAYKLLHN